MLIGICMSDPVLQYFIFFQQRPTIVVNLSKFYKSFLGKYFVGILNFTEKIGFLFIVNLNE